MQTVVQDKELTFDELVALHKRSPEEFEAYRQATISRAIQRLSDGDEDRLRKLNALQWQIMQVRRKHKDPLVCAAKLSSIMMASATLMRVELLKLREVLGNVGQLHE